MFLNQRGAEFSFFTPSAPPLTYTFKLPNGPNRLLRLALLFCLRWHHSPLAAPNWN